MKSERLGTDPMGRLILRMTLPTVAAQIVNLLYNIVDRIFIGHIPGIGDAALTGVGVTSPLIIIISAFSAFFGQGGAPLAAIELGKKERERAEKILGNSVTLLVITGLVLMVLIGLFKKPILYAIGASSETYPYASSYLSIYLLGTIPVLLSVGLGPFAIAQGASRIAMLATVAGAGANIALDWLLVSVLPFGVRGAAVATVISQCISGLWILLYLLLRADTMRIRRQHLRVRWSIFRKIASLGVSPFVMSSTESVIGFVMNSGLQRYGGDLYVGCLTVMQSVMQIVSVPVTGFTQGVTPIVSYNYGAGNRKRVVSAVKWMLLIMFSYTTIFAGASMLFPGFFARIFTSKAELIALTERALPVFMAGMLIFGVQRVCQTAFLALGQAKVSLFIALLRKVILLVPLALVLPLRFGAFGIYWAEPIADVLAAVTCGIIFLCTFRKILDRPPA